MPLSVRFRSVLAMFSASVCLLVPAAMAQGAAPSEFRWENSAEKGQADLLFGDRPVLRYMYALDTSTKERAHETYKVYHHVFSPSTRKIITKGPGGKYTHHRGMFVGFSKTGFEGRKLDFWHCNKGEKLRHVRFLEMAADAETGRMAAEIHWTDPDGKPVIVETRTIVATAIEDGWQFDWSTTLTSRRGVIELNGDRQHAGFQYRAAQAVAEENSATYVRPEGFPQQSEPYQVGGPVKHTGLNWFAMTYPLDGKTYRVTYFEAPGHVALLGTSIRPLRDVLPDDAFGRQAD